MNADERRLELNRITERVIGCVYQVSNTLGSGFLEKVYENALAHEIRKLGMDVAQQHDIEVWYDGIVVGKYEADLLVEGCVLIELKAIKALDEVHYAQSLNYLKATHLKICLLVNFGNPKVDIKRVVHDF